ncbi:MAG: hypothetical protein Q4F03_03090 [Eubacteriales bacterium]|nr:hypothetical protein [Eubacteriales bacterium]
MRKGKRWSVTAGAAVMALLLGTGMLEVNVYGSDFVSNVVLEEVPDTETEITGEDIFTDGNGLQDHTDGNGGDGNGADNNIGDGADMGSVGGGYMGGYSSGSPSGTSEKIIRQPKLMLESCNLSGAEVKAGSETALEAVLVNKGAQDRIYNLKVTLSVEAKDVFLSEKSFYFGRVGAKEKIYLNSMVKVMPGAEEGFVPVTASFEYEDKKGTACTGTERLEFHVVQPSKVHLECGDIPAEAASTDTLMLSVKVQNLSRTPVNNVRVSLKGKGLFPKEKVFVGNMEAGTQGEGVMRVYVGTRTMEKPGVDSGTSESEMFGNVKGKLVLAYEDSRGNTHKEEKKFKLEITKPKIQTLKVEKPKKANSWWFSVIAAGGAGMLAVIVLLLGRLRRQKVRIEEMKKMYGGSI